MSTMSMDVDRRMRAMMRQQQVDILELCYDRVGATFEAAQGACEQCESVDACVDWLESDKSRPAPEFCPNRLLFERFKAT